MNGSACSIRAMPAKEFSWNIYRLRGTPAAFIGSVDAPDEKTAIAKAIEEFRITDIRAARLEYLPQQDAA